MLDYEEVKKADDNRSNLYIINDIIDVGPGISVEAIGKRIDTLFSSRQISTQQACEMFGISYQAVHKWRHGCTLPDIENMYYLSRLFGVTIDYIISGDTKIHIIESHDDSCEELDER